MNEISLESLAKRVEALEIKLADKETIHNDPPWWNALGTVKNDEVFQNILAEGKAIREAERKAALQDVDGEPSE